MKKPHIVIYIETDGEARMATFEHEEQSVEFEESLDCPATYIYGPDLLSGD